MQETLFAYETTKTDTCTALLDAITASAQFFISIPLYIVMNAERRIYELPPQAWHTVYYGPIAIRLLSPQEGDLYPELKKSSWPYGLFLCIKGVP